MSVSWSKTLFHDDCNEFMRWNRHSEIWECPVCGFEIPDEEAEEDG